MGHYSEVQLVKEGRTVSNSEYFEQGFLQSKKKKKNQLLCLINPEYSYTMASYLLNRELTVGILFTIVAFSK